MKDAFGIQREISKKGGGLGKQGNAALKRLTGVYSKQIKAQGKGKSQPKAETKTETKKDKKTKSDPLWKNPYVIGGGAAAAGLGTGAAAYTLREDSKAR